MDKTTQEIVDLTKDLVKFRTTKDRPDEIRKCIDFIKQYFSGQDFVVKEFEKNSKVSLLISFRETKKPKLLLNGHIDIVEADEDQFTPVVKGKKLYGRGTSDMKSGVAGYMVLMKEVADTKPDMALMVVSDEEIGGMDCSGYLASLGYSGDFIVASEPNHTESPKQLNITVAEKGVLWIKIKVKGKACHGSRPWLGKNAIEILMKKYQKIKKMFPKTTSSDRWKTTANLGKISGGNSPNRVPDEAEMILDIRFTEETNAQAIIDKIKKVDDIEIEVIEQAPPMLNDDMNMINKLKACVETSTGNKCEFLKEHGASDLRYFSEKHVPSAIFGPYGTNYHGKGEYVDIESIGLFFKAMKDFVEKNIR